VFLLTLGADWLMKPARAFVTHTGQLLGLIIFSGKTYCSSDENYHHSDCVAVNWSFKINNDRKQSI